MDIFSTGYTGTDLVGNVATAAQTTFAGLGPVIELVGGLIVAFIAINYVVGLVKKAGRHSSR